MISDGLSTRKGPRSSDYYRSDGFCRFELWSHSESLEFWRSAHATDFLTSLPGSSALAIALQHSPKPACRIKYLSSDSCSPPRRLTKFGPLFAILYLAARLRMVDVTSPGSR